MLKLNIIIIIILIFIAYFKILLDLSNEDDELLFKKVAKFNDRPLLKDLLKEFSYPCENITFRYDAKLYKKRK